MKRKAEEEHVSSLSVFIPLIIVAPWAAVRCPHCEGDFQVDGKRWREPLLSVLKPGLELRGRPCPYCFKTSLIPLDFFPKKVRARLAAERQ